MASRVAEVEKLAGNCLQKVTFEQVSWQPATCAKCVKWSEMGLFDTEAKLVSF